MRLKDRFSDYLFDMRTKETWDRDSNDRVAAVVKELGRRGESLGAAGPEGGARSRARSSGCPPRAPSGSRRCWPCARPCRTRT